MEQNFTTKAAEALQAATSAAVLAGNPQVEMSHILCALLEPAEHRRGGLDLHHETLGAEHGGELGLQHLHRARGIHKLNTDFRRRARRYRRPIRHRAGDRPRRFRR